MEEIFEKLAYYRFRRLHRVSQIVSGPKQGITSAPKTFSRMPAR